MAEKLNAQQTTDSLMLLKGTRDKLATLEITPGAIYFTTDYPGIYVDFGAEGSQPERRVRMGDVTVVDRLSDLKDLATDAISAGQKLGANTLYYAKDKNVLCIYDEGEEKFVWVNDTSVLSSELSDLSDTVDSLGTDLQDLNDLVGLPPAGSTATVFGTIAIEEARAKGVEKDLQEQIDAIAGEDGGSISDLQSQIDDINDAIGNDGLAGEIASLETIVSGTGGHGSRLDEIEIKLQEIDESADVNVIEKIKVTISGGADPSVSEPDDDKTVTITLPKDLAQYDGDNVLGGIAGNITNINTAITNLKGEGYQNTETVHGNAEAIAAIKLDIADNVKGTDWGVSMSPTLMDLFRYMNDIDDNVTDIESNISSIETDIATLEQTIDDTKQDVKTYTDEQVNQARADLSQEINDNLAAADAMTFKGSVKLKTGQLEPDLPTTNVNAGDTYVIEEGADSQDNKYHAGDMIIALKDQDKTFNENVLGSSSSVSNIYNLNQTVTVRYFESFNDNTAHEYTKTKTDKFDYAGYDLNNNGSLVPVLYEEWDGVGGPDYEAPWYYVGRASVTEGSTVYDKWRRIENFSEEQTIDYTWESEDYKYVYTDIIVGVTYPSSEWVHVKTGYDGIHEAKLSVAADPAVGSPVGNKVQLTSHVGTPLGSVKFVSDSTNIEITKTPGQDGVISFNLVWGTF